MAIHSGRHQFGAESGRISLRTFRDGLAAQAGHDLTIDATRWSAEVVGSQDGTPESLQATIDMGALVVRSGSGGLKPLTDRDKREIAVTARKVLAADRFPEATFVGTAFQPGPDGSAGTISGTLSLAGQSRPLELRVTSAGAGLYHATATVRQTDFGLKPYTGFLGALKVRDTVDVEIEVDVSTAEARGAGGMTVPVPRSGESAAMTAGDEVASLFARREQPVRDLADQAGAVADACYQMALRFHQGGKLVVFGTGGSSTDAQHVAVEFVHPVIVGKRALPAISLTSDVATVTGIAARSGMASIFAHQLRYLAERADIALGISADGNCASVLSGLLTARELGLLTVALVGADGGAIATSPAVDHLLLSRSADPRVVKEMQVTTYHVLWELVHVFFEQPGVLGPGVLT